MDEEPSAKLEERMKRPTGLAAAREFLQTYVHDADMVQLERVVRRMLRVNPVTVLDGADAFDANRDLDEYDDENSKRWLADLRDRLRRWIAEAGTR